MASWIAAGAALIGLGIAGRKLNVHLPKITKQFEAVIGAQHRYKGGFQNEIDKYEAGKILGISSNSSTKRIKDVHKKLMFQNHPDRGGSPYLAAKINQAKDYLEKGNK